MPSPATIRGKAYGEGFFANTRVGAVFFLSFFFNALARVVRGRG